MTDETRSKLVNQATYIGTWLGGFLTAKYGLPAELANSIVGVGVTVVIPAAIAWWDSKKTEAKIKEAADGPRREVLTESEREAVREDGGG